MKWRTPDNRVLTLSSEFVDRAWDWVFTCDRLVPSGLSRYHVGSKGACVAELRESWPDARFASFSYQGGTCWAVETGERGESPQTTFVWEGAKYELYTSVGGLNVDPQRFVDYLESLAIDETGQGLVAAGGGARHLARSLLKIAFMPIPEVGAVSVYPRGLVSVNMPRNRGRRVASGELWSVRDTTAGDDFRALFVASESAAMLISPTERSTAAGVFVEAAVVRMTEPLK